MKDPMNPFKAPLFPGSMFWLGTIGLGYLLYRLWRSRSQLGIALVLAIYFPLMVFFPPVFTVLYHVLPLWVIDRFTAMNMLNYISVPIGIFALVMVIAYVLKPVFGGITKPLKEHGILLVTLGLVMALSAYVFTTSYRAVAVQRPGNASYYSFMDRTEQSFGSILKDEAVVVASPGNSFFLAAVAPIDVIGIEEGHTTPAASVKNRASCQQHLLTTFNYEDLKAVNAAYVVIAKYDKDYTLQRDVIISRPYLQQVGQNQDFQVFKFDVNRKPDGILQPAFKACTDFQAIENGSVKS